MKITHSSILAGLLLFSVGVPRSPAQSLTQPPNPSAAPADLVNAFHAAFGDHHARAVHTKGIILEGTFVPDAQASSLTRAMHLQKKPSRVVVRFSDFTGLPEIPDNTSAASPRGLAVKFISPGGANTDVVCHSFNGFPVATSEEFRLFFAFHRGQRSHGRQANRTGSLPRHAPDHQDVFDHAAFAGKLGDDGLFWRELLQIHQRAK